MPFVAPLPRINSSTLITGNINAQAFTGCGVGNADTAAGTGTYRIQFNIFPNTFNPQLCRSWKCKRHKLFPDEQDGGKNLFTIAQERNASPDYDVHDTVTYSGAGTGTIFTQSKVRYLAPASVVDAQTFEGTYNGPTLVIAQPPYTELLIPGGPGRIVVRGSRQIEVGTPGNFLNVSWQVELLFVDRTMELPFIEQIGYTVVSAWNPATFVMTKQISVVIRPYFFLATP
jgi:hypothetical protein